MGLQVLAIHVVWQGEAADEIAVGALDAMKAQPFSIVTFTFSLQTPGISALIRKAPSFSLMSTRGLHSPLAINS